MKSVSRSLSTFCFCVMALGSASATHAQFSDGVVRFVVMNDQSSGYADQGGKGSVLSAQMAVDDVGGKVAGVPVELISIDHQNKVDLATSQAKKLIDIDHVDAFIDMSNSTISLAIQEITRASNKIAIHVGSAHADLYGKACSPTSALWLYDTYALGKGLTKALYDDKHKNWFLLSADYAFGQAMSQDMKATLEGLGGKVVGSVRHPLGAADYSSFLLQAPQDTNVLAVLNAGLDTNNAVKQAVEFGIVKKGMKIAAPIFTILNVKSIGSESAQGTTFLVGYYWDRDAESRAFAKRWEAKMGRPPSHIQAAVYSATKHYLKAIEAAKTDEAVAVMRKMKELPVVDFMTKGARLREDGRLMRDLLIVEAKAPKDVKAPWDLLRVTGTVAAADMVRPMADGGCSFVKK